jgi:hypothetical protein
VKNMKRIYAIALLGLMCIPLDACNTRMTVDIMNAAYDGNPELQNLRNRLATYDRDGRMSIVDLYRIQNLLIKQGWMAEEIFREEVPLATGDRMALPSNCLRTPRKGPALWILAGIHGEEPAGPNALAENIAAIEVLRKLDIPIVILPLLNPLGYQRNWRYPNVAVYSESTPGSSVGDSDHVLPDEAGSARRPAPACPQSGLLARKVLELARDYPPILTLDLHEDSLLDKGYLYSQGPRGENDPIAREIVALFVDNQFPILMEGTTRFGEAVKGGIISGARDGSIDELLSAAVVIVDGSAQKGPSGSTVLVLETSCKGTKLAERKIVHKKVLELLPQLWEKARAFLKEPPAAGE